MSSSDDMKREKFENWLKRNFPPVPNMLRRDGGRYFLPSTESLWELWNQEMKNEIKESVRAVISLAFIFIASYFLMR